MAPKVAFPAAFGILIGTCLFKILIPDEELLILKGDLLIPKGELQLYRNHYLYTEVAAHIVNASSACNLVYVKILQTAQVVLVSTVGKVLARKIEREKRLPWSFTSVPAYIFNKVYDGVAVSVSLTAK